MANAVEATGLVKRFGKTTALAGVDLVARPGRVLGVLGPNGADKTTTVRTLGTLLTPTSCSATVAAIRLNVANGPQIRTRISIMPESPGLYLRLTVNENLECFAGLHELDDVRGRIQRAAGGQPRRPAACLAQLTARSAPLSPPP